MKYNLISVIFLCLLMIGCINKKHPGNDINFKDTLYRTHIYKVVDNDTIMEHDTTWFKPTAIIADTSGFRYGISFHDKQGFETDTYTIYFNRKEAIAFCDSMLHIIPDNEGDGTNFQERLLYKDIKGQAADNKMYEAYCVDELPILLDRFNPFIINKTTGYKPGYLIIRLEDIESGGETKNYYFKNNQGDTCSFWGTMVRSPEIEIPAQ